MPITITEESREDRLLLKIAGDAGVEYADDLADALLNIQSGRHRETVIDLSEMTFISSLSMGTMLQFTRGWGVGPNVGLVFIAAQPLVFEAFERAQLTREMRFYPTLKDAEAAGIVPSD